MTARLKCLLMLLGFTACGLPLFATDWRPVTPEELSLKTPKVEPTAAAEALFTETWVSDQTFNGTEPYTTYTHYIRLKIFTDQGVNQYGTVNVEYEGNARVSDVAARTIQPDGSIVEMTKDAIFDRALAKRKHLNWRSLSFAVPAVRVGSIIEYRWREFHDGELADYAFLHAQQEFPVQQAIFHIKPLESPYFPYRMQYLGLNTVVPPFKQESGGFSTTVLQNLVAYHEEEDSPPETNIQPTIMVFYAEDHKETPEHFWKSEGKRRYNLYKNDLKINNEVRQIAEEVTAGAKSDDEKLARLLTYCQKKIKDVAGPDVTDIDRKEFKPNHQTADTLKRGIGTRRDIELAFTALAIAAGYDARIAYVCDRQKMLFRKDAMIPYFPETDAAVQVNGKWKFYDVADKNVIAGELPWYQQGTQVLIADGKEPELVDVDVTPPAGSNAHRTGRLVLDEAGGLEGDIQETLTGHVAADWRSQYQQHSAASRDKLFEGQLKSELPGAEVTNIKLGDPGNLAVPVKNSYHLKIPNYATRTGKRLFFAPAVLEANKEARYSASTRRYDLLFRYPWSESDDISISLPAGYALDHPDLAAPVLFEPVGIYKTSVLAMPNRILYHRELVFGEKGTIYFPVKSYPILKKVFDGVHQGDSHMLTLRAQPSTTAKADGAQ